MYGMCLATYSGKSDENVCVWGGCEWCVCGVAVSGVGGGCEWCVWDGCEWCVCGVAVSGMWEVVVFTDLDLVHDY